MAQTEFTKCLRSMNCYSPGKLVQLSTSVVDDICLILGVANEWSIRVRQGPRFEDIVQSGERFQILTGRCLYLEDAETSHVV